LTTCYWPQADRRSFSKQKSYLQGLQGLKAAL